VLGVYEEAGAENMRSKSDIDSKYNPRHGNRPRKTLHVFKK